MMISLLFGVGSVVNVNIDGFTKTVTVMSNAGNGTITLKIHGTVEAAESVLPEKKSGPTAQ